MTSPVAALTRNEWMAIYARVGSCISDHISDGLLTADNFILWKFMEDYSDCGYAHWSADRAVLLAKLRAMSRTEIGVVLLCTADYWDALES